MQDDQTTVIEKDATAHGNGANGAIETAPLVVEATAVNGNGASRDGKDSIPGLEALARIAAEGQTEDISKIIDHALEKMRLTRQEILNCVNPGENFVLTFALGQALHEAMKFDHPHVIDALVTEIGKLGLTDAFLIPGWSYPHQKKGDDTSRKVQGDFGTPLHTGAVHCSYQSIERLLDGLASLIDKHPLPHGITFEDYINLECKGPTHDSNGYLTAMDIVVYQPMKTVAQATAEAERFIADHEIKGELATMLRDHAKKLPELQRQRAGEFTTLLASKGAAISYTISVPDDSVIPPMRVARTLLATSHDRTEMPEGAEKGGWIIRNMEFAPTQEQVDQTLRSLTLSQQRGFFSSARR